MRASTEPSALLSHLYRTDGSATFSQNGYTIIGAVNGPIEVTRRDELPEEAAIDVIVRPASGVGGVRERHLESIIESTLRQIILIHSFPRSLIQVTLQVTQTPENETSTSKLNPASSSLPILAALLQTSVLALLSAATPLGMTMASTIFAITREGNIVRDPSLIQVQEASSVHVMAFSSQGDLLVSQSEGEFTMDQWDEIYAKAEVACRGSESDDGDAMKDIGEDTAEGGMMEFIKTVMEEKVESDLHWRT